MRPRRHVPVLLPPVQLPPVLLATVLVVAALGLSGCSLLERDDTPGHGRVVRVDIPGTTSHFAARPALVYLPPVLRQHPDRHLPLLELLHGTSGGPQDWVTKGGLQRTADSFAASHGGAAPIVVVADVNGSKADDSECVRVGSGNVEQYLTVDLPTWMSAHYPVTDDHARWAVAGNSEGGTCAITLTLRHPDVFAVFGDLSGLARPTVGEHDDPDRTRDELFDGSQADYDSHDPLWLVAHHRYPHVSGWFEAGEKDTEVVLDQNRLVTAARSAGITLRATTIPGGHRWTVWAAALRSMLPWLWQRVGGA